MKIIALICLFCLLSCGASVPAAAETLLVAPAGEARDGRTLKLLLESGEVELRLAGVLVPEPMHPSRRVDEMAGKAQLFLTQQIAGRTLEASLLPAVEGRETGAAWIHAANDRASLNERILQAGLGVPIPEPGLTGDRTALLAAAARAALQAQSGIYADDGSLEFLWRGASHATPLVIFPMAAGRWGLQYGSYVRLRLEREELGRLLQAMDPLLRGEAGTEADSWLQEQGWLENPQNRLDDVSVISWQDVEDRIGMVTRVRGQIVSSKNTGKAAYLNFHADWKSHLSVVVFAGDFSRFGGDPAELYRGRELIVTGRVKQYQGRPEIIVSTPDQIETLPATSDQ